MTCYSRSSDTTGIETGQPDTKGEESAQSIQQPARLIDRSRTQNRLPKNRHGADQSEAVAHNEIGVLQHIVRGVFPEALLLATERKHIRLAPPPLRRQLAVPVLQRAREPDADFFLRPGVAVVLDELAEEHEGDGHVDAASFGAVADGPLVAADAELVRLEVPRRRRRRRRCFCTSAWWRYSLRRRR